MSSDKQYCQASIRLATANDNVVEAILGWDRTSNPSESISLSVHRFINTLIGFKLSIKLSSNGELILSDGIKYRSIYTVDDISRIYWRLHRTFYKNAPTLGDKMVNYFLNALASEMSHCREAGKTEKSLLFKNAIEVNEHHLVSSSILTEECTMEQEENVISLLQGKINESGNSRWVVVDYNDEGHIDIVCSVCKDACTVKHVDNFLKNHRECRKCNDINEKSSRDFYRLGDMSNWFVEELGCVIKLPSQIMDEIITRKNWYSFNTETHLIKSSFGLQVEVSAGLLGLMKLMLVDYNVRSVYQWKDYLGLPFSHPLMKKLSMIYDYCQHMLDRVDFRFFNISREWRKKHPVLQFKATREKKNELGEALCDRVQQLVLTVNAI
jgi:hypothetical protein